MKSSIKFPKFLLVILSAGLLILAFPKTNFWPLAWIGLVPLLGALDDKTPRQAFGMAYGCGLIFFTGTLYWIGHVTIFGAIFLIAYLALYFGLFGLGVSCFSRCPLTVRIWVLPSLWVVLEFLRGYLLSGFGWASLGQSQYQNLVVIQIADITGMLGVSFLVVMGNVFFKELLVQNRHSMSDRHRVSVLLCIVLGFVLGYGIWRMGSWNPSSSEEMSVAVVQANIAQDIKWQEEAWPRIIDQHLVLTEEAAKEHPDLIIWPETAFPGFLLKDPKYFWQLRDLVQRINIPILFGSITQEEGNYFNSAALLSSSGRIGQRYDKVHLVPFGEYIPLRGWFPFLSDIIPISDFSSGKEYTVFDKELTGNRKFSVLICFEDTMGRLARKFVDAGAGFLVNITNDAWFKDSAAPYMHLQSAVFRTVENRRGLVRAANTGVSCFINPLGKIVHSIQDKMEKKIFISGYAVYKVRFSNKKTFYTKYGDVFTLGCFGCILGAIGLYKRKGKSS